MNLNANPRLELVEVSDSVALAVDGCFDEVFGGQPPGELGGGLPPVRSGVRVGGRVRVG